MPRDDDAELAAIQQVIGALEPLDEGGRSRVLQYVFSRLGITAQSAQGKALEVPAGDAPIAPNNATRVEPASRAGDIRSLKEEKQPKSANQMAALVAYYLAEVAPQEHRTDAISTVDITKYFKQAGFPLPQKPRVTLANAANAGYFDSVGDGRYRLNPVGFNLVVHGMPAKGTQRPTARRREKNPRRKTSKVGRP